MPQCMIISGPSQFTKTSSIVIKLKFHKIYIKMFNARSPVLVLSLVVAMFVVCCEGQDKYSNKYDYVDVDSILAVPRQRNQYYRCFIGETRCATPDAKFFRDHLREAIVTNCAKCTEKQKTSFDKISIFYAENEPEKYRAIVAKAIEETKRQ